MFSSRNYKSVQALRDEPFRGGYEGGLGKKARPCYRRWRVSWHARSKRTPRGGLQRSFCGAPPRLRLKPRGASGQIVPRASCGYCCASGRPGRRERAKSEVARAVLLSESDDGHVDLALFVEERG